MRLPTIAICALFPLAALILSGSGVFGNGVMLIVFGVAKLLWGTLQFLWSIVAYSVPFLAAAAAGYLVFGYKRLYSEREGWPEYMCAGIAAASTLFVTFGGAYLFAAGIFLLFFLDVVASNEIENTEENRKNRGKGLFMLILFVVVFTAADLAIRTALNDEEINDPTVLSEIGADRLSRSEINSMYMPGESETQIAQDEQKIETLIAQDRRRAPVRRWLVNQAPYEVATIDARGFEILTYPDRSDVDFACHAGLLIRDNSTSDGTAALARRMCMMRHQTQGADMGSARVHSSKGGVEKQTALTTRDNALAGGVEIRTSVTREPEIRSFYSMAPMLRDDAKTAREQQDTVVRALIADVPDAHERATLTTLLDYASAPNVSQERGTPITTVEVGHLAFECYGSVLHSKDRNLEDTDLEKALMRRYCLVNAGR